MQPKVLKQPLQPAFPASAQYAKGVFEEYTTDNENTTKKISGGARLIHDPA
jgi:hypothetical protein